MKGHHPRKELAPQLTHGELLQLKRWNTPTLYNGWEPITRHDSARDAFNLEEVRDFMPQMGVMIGYAVTAVSEPSTRKHKDNKTGWLDYYRHVAAQPGPKIVVVQDLDKPRTVGAFWGEVNANIHKALGCVGTIIDGAIGDLSVAAIAVLLGGCAMRVGDASDGVQLVIHPGPPGEKPSALGRVFVNGGEAFVHHALVMADIEKHPDKLWSHKHPAAGENAGFVLFDFEGGPVDVQVKLARPCTSASLHPLSANIAARVDSDTVSFTLDKPRKVTLRVDGQWTDAIHFLCSTPEKDAPKPGDPNVVYYGPGVHRITSLKLESDSTLYLAPGALLKAELAADEPMKFSERIKLTVPTGGPIVHGQNAQSIRIRGRGILDSSAIPHFGKASIAFSNCTNVSVEGVVIRDSSNWNVTFTNCDGAWATDVKIITARLNSDGINSVGSRHVRIGDCFVRNRDDTFAVKTMNPTQVAEDIVVEDCVIWNDWGFGVGVTYETRAAIRNVTYRNIDILHCEHSAMGVHVVDSATIEDIHFENIRIEHANSAILRLDVTSNMWGTDQDPGHIRRITAEHITFTGAKPPGLTVAGHDADHRVEEVTIRNLVINGKVVTTPEEAQLKANEHTRTVRITP